MPKIDANVDYFMGGQAFGPIASRLASNGMDARALRPWVGRDGRSYVTVNTGGEPKAVLIGNAATLRKDEWKQMDDVVLQISKERLVGVADLLGRGLRYSIPNGLGKTVLEYENDSDVEEAEVSMAGVTQGKNDRVEYDILYLPLPITHKDFQINIRTLTASRERGMPLDTTNVAKSTRRVSEKVEEYLFNGSGSFAYGGGTIFGYTDVTNRNTGTLTAAWSTATGEQILDDVRAMKQESIDAMHYGPYMLYIPTAYEVSLDDDFKAASEKTIRQRILEVGGVQDVKVADKLTAGQVLLIQMTDDVVRMVEGLPIQVVEWDTLGGFIKHFKVLTILVPQVRTGDQDGNSGVTHYSAP